MNNSLFRLTLPENEPMLSFAPGTKEREDIKTELTRQTSEIVEIPLIIGGKKIYTGKTIDITMPHDHNHVIAKCHQAETEHVKMAIDAALSAKEEWMTISWVERAAICNKAAELISQKYRMKIIAATMLGQGKNVYQAEVDSTCETIDFLRFNTFFAFEIYSDQPKSTNNQMNRMEYRPLEGFVFTISPFNFTAIGSNLNMSPVLMGNVTVWKPATTSVLSNYYLMEIFKEAGLPDGVINFLP
jgi:1-pyrroline-5-carboxylate dehydrogenase